MDPIELADWKTIIAALGGLGLVVAAFRVKLNINIDFNDIVDQIITYRREAKHSRVVQECPHVYPLDVNGFGNRPGFKVAYVLDEDGAFICSMCGLTGFITKEMVASLEAYWSTRTWKEWGEKMERRHRAEGIRIPSKSNSRRRRNRRTRMY